MPRLLLLLLLLVAILVGAEGGKGVRSSGNPVTDLGNAVDATVRSRSAA